MNTEKNKRGKGMGYVSQRKNGLFVGRVTINGKPYDCYGKTYKEAEKKLNEYIRSFNTTGFSKKKTFLVDYINEWLINFKQPTLRPSSYDRLERTFNQQIKTSKLKNCQLGSIKPADIQELINEKSKSLSYSSIKKIYQLLNACFKHAVVSRDIELSPMVGVCLPRESALTKKTKEIKVFSKDELEKMLALYRNHTELQVYRYIPAYILLVNTGLRIGEALALQWNNIDFNKKIIKVNQSVSKVVNRNNVDSKTISLIGDVKTSKGKRSIPLNQTAINMLLSLKDYYQNNQIDSKFVIATKEGNQVSHSTITKNFILVQKNADIPQRGLHSLRHTFATRLISSGVDVKITSTLLGHSSVSVTYNIYVHPSAAQEFDAVNKLDF